MLKETPAAWEVTDQKTVPAVILGPVAKTAGEYEVKWSGRDGTKCDCDRILLSGQYEVWIVGKAGGMTVTDRKTFVVAKPHTHCYGFKWEEQQDDTPLADSTATGLGGAGYNAKAVKETTAKDAYKELREKDAIFWFWGHGARGFLPFRDMAGNTSRMGLDVTGANDAALPQPDGELKDVLIAFVWACFVERNPGAQPPLPDTVNTRLRELGVDITVGAYGILLGGREADFINKFFEEAKKRDDNGGYGSVEHCVNKAKNGIAGTDTFVTVVNLNLSTDEPKTLYPARYGCAAEKAHGQ